MWLSKGSNPTEVTPIFSPFFIYSKKNLCFFFNKCRATRKLFEKSCNSLPLIFNELQANYMDMKVNCKTVIFNELQLYEINCNDIKRRKSRCRNVGFNMLNPLSLFRKNFILKFFYQTVLIICITKTYQENFIFYSLLFRDILYLYKTLYFYYSFFL